MIGHHGMVEPDLYLGACLITSTGVRGGGG